jgi:arylsulfatase A-like enzyme
MRVRAIGGGLAGGLLAGAVVGAAEAVVSWAAGTSPEPAPVAWAVVGYGALGGLGGLGIGGVMALVGGEGFGAAVAAVGVGLAFVVGRFRVIRDVFAEQLPPGRSTQLVQVAALVAAAGIAWWLWRRLAAAERNGRRLTNPIVAVLVVAIVAIGWTLAVGRPEPATVVGSPGPGRPGATGPNVILVMVDTLRADRLSVYGYTGGQTPHVDALAADGIRYAKSFAQASWTRPSVATILTSLYPSSHGAIHKADILPDRVETLAEAIGFFGYRTVGFPNNVNVSAAFNFQQGFQEFDFLAPALFFDANEAAAKLTLYNGLRLVRERFFARRVDVEHYYQPAEVVTDRVLAWIDGHRKGPPFFLYAHYMDPHDPYMVHPFDGEGYARVAMPKPSPELARRLSQVYDGEVRYFDEHLGRLIDGLRARGLYDDTIIVLVADHGEEFHEHGGWWHGTTLYDEQTHVPLIIKPARGGAHGVVVDTMTRNLDVAPTILAAVGAPVPPAMQGKALALDGAGIAPEPKVFSEEDFEGNVLQAVRTPTWKLVVANKGNPRGLAPAELFHLEADPGEHKNLAGTEAGHLEEMRAALGRSVLEARAHEGAGVQTNVDEVTRDRLKALGYLN